MSTPRHLIVAGLLVAITFFSTPASTASPAVTATAGERVAHAGGSDTPRQVARGFMRTINKGQYGKARAFARQRVINAGRAVRRDGFHFTSLQSCDHDMGSESSTCLTYFKRRSDGLEGSFYLVVKGTAGHLKAIRSYQSYGD